MAYMYANDYLEMLQPHLNIEEKKDRERELKTMLWQS